MDANSASAEAEAKEVVSKDESWSELAGLRCTLSVDLPVTDFRVRDLLMLDVNTVVDSHQNATSQAPVWVNGARVGWAEFDVLRTRLAIRISELG